MDQDESLYFDFSRLTNRYPSEIQHQASREMVIIVNNKMKPPGGEPIWSWYSKAEQLDYLKGFLKPLAVQEGETAKAKDPEDIIVLSDTEDETNPENITIVKPLPLVSVKQEPIDDEHEKLSDPEKNLSISDDVNPVSTVVYGPHQLKPPASLFSKLNLFNIMDEHRRKTPADPIDDSPLDFEFETGNPAEIQVAEPTDEEENLPLLQAKTRSSTAQQEKETSSPVRKSKRKQTVAEQPVPQETTRSMKRRKTIQAQQPESQPDASAITPLEVITPQFLSDEYAARWDSTNQRKILSERYLDVEKFKSQCQLMPVLEKINLVKSVTTQRSYPPIAIKEFYANLMKTIKEAGSQVYGRVWLRGKEYNFDTRTINLYLGINASDIEDPVIGENTITKVITGGTYSYWLAETNMLPAKSLTTKYAIMHKLAMTNWMPNEHRGGLNLLMATLIYKIGKGIPVDLGNIIFKHVASFRKPESKESKVKLPFPCTIYGVLRTQGFKPKPNEPMEAPQVITIDARIKQGTHVLDIFPEHASSSAPALNLDAPFSSKLTAQHLDKSIRDLNTIIQILVEKKTIEMQLREQLRLRDQEMTGTVAEPPTDPPTDPSMASNEQTAENPPEDDLTVNSQEDESSESE
ncbi:uncharacterized protein LOC116020165 [Ipomoea triloba]|uniref:uncharacterized protein LOC116020165 n=1 Tax=Ipomoea triloba TaxID=35885 RepID=UPI00125E20EF|nr:uncharacterized protein LOC116020165 [Ipomoea triloba]